MNKENKVDYIFFKANVNLSINEIVFIRVIVNKTTIQDNKQYLDESKRQNTHTNFQINILLLLQYTNFPIIIENILIIDLYFNFIIIILNDLPINRIITLKFIMMSTIFKLLNTILVLI